MRNYRDLDGWDALFFLGGAVATPAVLVALKMNLTPYEIGGYVISGGGIPFAVRRRFWPATVKNASKHNVGTLLLVALGGFLTLIGLALGALFTAFLHDTHDPDAPRAIILIPLGALVVGGLLMFAGVRLARKAGTPRAPSPPLPRG